MKPENFDPENNGEDFKRLEMLFTGGVGPEKSKFNRMWFGILVPFFIALLFVLPALTGQNSQQKSVQEIPRKEVSESSSQSNQPEIFLVVCFLGSIAFGRLRAKGTKEILAGLGEDLIPELGQKVEKTFPEAHLKLALHERNVTYGVRSIFGKIIDLIFLGVGVSYFFYVSNIGQGPTTSLIACLIAIVVLVSIVRFFRNRSDKSLHSTLKDIHGPKYDELIASLPSWKVPS